MWKKWEKVKAKKRAFSRTHTEAFGFFFCLYEWRCRMLGSRKKKHHERASLASPYITVSLVEYELRRTHTLNWHTKRHKKMKTRKKIDKFAYFLRRGSNSKVWMNHFSYQNKIKCNKFKFFFCLVLFPFLNLNFYSFLNSWASCFDNPASWHWECVYRWNQGLSTNIFE